MARIRQQGVRSVTFLDDIMVMSQSKEELKQTVTQLIQMLELLGFVVNQKKLCLEPMQSILFLGFTIDSSVMTISLPEEKLAQIQQDCDWALQQKAVSVRDLCHFIGRLTAAN